MSYFSDAATLNRPNTAPEPQRTAARAKPDPVPAELDFRQLRHQTKNALQLIIGLISATPALRDTPDGKDMARELEERICLLAETSNALFGLTRAPGSMVERLRCLSESVVALLRDPAQTIHLDVVVHGRCPASLRIPVLRVAHELLGNAMKHGMRQRPTGRISVRLERTRSGTTRLSVGDDGWGFDGRPAQGEGLSLAQSLAERHDGVFHLSSDGLTVATLELPHRLATRR